MQYHCYHQKMHNMTVLLFVNVSLLSLLSPSSLLTLLVPLAPGLKNHHTIPKIIYIKKRPVTWIKQTYQLKDGPYKVPQKTSNLTCPWFPHSILPLPRASPTSGWARQRCRARAAAPGYGGTGRWAAHIGSRRAPVTPAAPLIQWRWYGPTLSLSYLKGWVLVSGLVTMHCPRCYSKIWFSTYIFQSL